jgi:gluconolactonase
MACRRNVMSSRRARSTSFLSAISPNGKLLGKILVPYRVSNLVFGGLAKNRLFIGGSHTLYAIFLNRRGAQTP